MNPAISIVMPVYNAEKTVRTMLDSIIAQSFTDWELIVVDDGSTDNSGAILDNYAVKEPRIRVLHKQNGGVAMARQDGVSVSTGKYVIHADADDWMESDMLKDMWNVAVNENADIVICDFYTDIPGKDSMLSRQQPSSLTPMEVLYDLYTKKLFGALWHKLIKRSVYDKASARFYRGINYCEDLLLLTQILTATTPEIAYLPKAHYHYVLGDESLTRRVSLQGLESMRRFHEKAKELLPHQERFGLLKELFLKNEFSVYFMNYLYADKKELLDSYRKVKNVVRKHSGLRWKLGYGCIELGFVGLAHKLIKF